MSSLRERIGLETKKFMETDRRVKAIIEFIQKDPTFTNCQSVPIELIEGLITDAVIAGATQQMDYISSISPFSLKENSNVT